MAEKHEKTFYLNSGKTFTTLKGLAKELRGMSQDVYEHHVQPHKNDFAAWVKNSLKDEELSTKLEKRLHKVEIELEILRHLVHGETKKVSKKKKITAKPATVPKKKEPKKKTTPKKVVKKKSSSKKK